MASSRPAANRVTTRGRDRGDATRVAMHDATIILGHYGLIVALFAAGWAVVGSTLSGITKARGLQISAERSLWVASGLTGMATLCLVKGFLTDDFRLDAVYFYSSTSQALE